MTLRGFKRGERQKSRLVISSKCLILLTLLSIAGMGSMLATSVYKDAENRGSRDVITQLVKGIVENEEENGQDNKEQLKGQLMNEAIIYNFEMLKRQKEVKELCPQMSKEEVHRMFPLRPLF